MHVKRKGSNSIQLLIGLEKDRRTWLKINCIFYKEGNDSAQVRNTKPTMRVLKPNCSVTTNILSMP